MNIIVSSIRIVILIIPSRLNVNAIDEVLSVIVIISNRYLTSKEINKKISELKGAKKFNSKKHSGVIKLPEDPLIIQNRLRDEWK